MKLIVVVFLVACTQALTTSQVNTMIEDLVDTFDVKASYGDTCGADCEYGSMIASWVRLPFHDAVGGGGPNGEGGSNGCIDPTDPNNNGLNVTIIALDKVYQKYSSLLSRADFWVLAGNVALAFTTTQGETPLPSGMQPPAYTMMVPFSYGRVDQANCSGLDIGNVPPADITWQGLKDLWVTRIGMTVRGCVAIMGAHSLGRCRFANSGFDGAWTDTASSMSNAYYTTMLSQKWSNNNKSDVWIDDSPAFPGKHNLMITADVEPLFSPSGKCPHFGGGKDKGCPFNPEGAPIFMQYAVDQQSFYDEFQQAFVTMVGYQYPNLKVPTDDVEPVTPASFIKK